MLQLQSLAPFIWMTIIYLFSNQANSADTTAHIFGSWNFYVRKSAHIFEFAVLCWLFFQAARQSKKLNDLSTQKTNVQHIHTTEKKKALIQAILLSLLYAIFDEWHQSFIQGRTSSACDVLIDSIGIAGVALYIIYKQK